MDADEQTPQGPETGRGPLTNGLLGCLAMIVILVILFTIVRPGTAPVASGPALRVTAQELDAAYRVDEAAAQDRYGNHVLEVSGTIAAVQLGIVDEPFVMLRGRSENRGPQVSLAEGSRSRAGELVRGQAVRLRCGGVSGIAGTPMLRECALLP